MDPPKRQLKTLLRRIALLARQFDGSPESVNSIHSTMDTADSSMFQHFLPGSFSRLMSPSKESGILYADVYKDDYCHVNTFGLLKTGLKIPLHDHPEQNAVMKVYQGSVSIRSFTILDRDVDNSKGGSILVRYEGELVLSSRNGQETAVLGPETGNIHEVTSLEPHTYFCDVFFPNSPNCYYYQRPSDPLTVGQELILNRIRCPRDFYCDNMEFPSFPEFDL